MGQTAAIALLNGTHQQEHTPKCCYCIFGNVSFAFWEAGWQQKAVYPLIKFYILRGKSLVFMFNFSFHYKSSDDRRLMIFILAQLGCIIDSRDLAYKLSQPLAYLLVAEQRSAVVRSAFT